MPANKSQPGRLRRFIAAARRFSEAMGRVVSTLVLLLLYFVLFAPIGIVLRLWSDPLKLKRRVPGESLWVARPAQPDDLETARRQA